MGLAILALALGFIISYERFRLITAEFDAILQRLEDYVYQRFTGRWRSKIEGFIDSV